MGISPASAVSTALNLFSILSLPMGQNELDQDMAKINSHMHELVPKLFVGYDRNSRPLPSDGKAVEIQSLLVVDHIERLDETEQALTFHGSLMLMWRDERLMWEPADYGQLGSLAFTGFDTMRFWSPGVIIKGITIPSRQLVMLHNAIYTLKSSGLIIAELAVSIKAACRIELANYPNDNQTCFVFLFTPSYASSGVTFSTFSSMLSKESLQGSIGFNEQQSIDEEDQSNILNTTIAVAGGFKLVGMNVQRFYAHGEFFTVNESVAALFSSITNTVLRYEICLQRQMGAYYTATVSIPLFCITISGIPFIFHLGFVLRMTFLGVILSNYVSILLVVCVLLMLLQNERMTKVLPVDYDSEPLCARLSRFLLLQLVFMLLFRVWFALEAHRLLLLTGNGTEEQQKVTAEEGDSAGKSIGIVLLQFIERTRPSSMAALGYIHFIIRCLLAFEAVSMFWLLFC